MAEQVGGRDQPALGRGQAQVLGHEREDRGVDEPSDTDRDRKGDEAAERDGKGGTRSGHGLRILPSGDHVHGASMPKGPLGSDPAHDRIRTRIRIGPGAGAGAGPSTSRGPRDELPGAGMGYRVGPGGRAVYPRSANRRRMTG